MSDAECLAELAGGERSEAFAFIVRRYAGLVYSTARRIVRQDQLAEDITQATFVALYRKAPSVDPRTLAGWLVNATRLTAMATMRSESRREKHETNAAILQRARDLASDEPTVNEIAPLLDEALSRLGDTDRTAVVMRFLQGEEFAQIGATLGLSEDASRKRVTRSLAKLRGILMRRGFVASVGGLAVVLASQQAKAVPPALLTSILNSSLPAPSSGSAALTKLAATTFKSANIKLFLLAAAGLVALVGGIWLGQPMVTSSAKSYPTTLAPSAPMPATSKYAATAIHDPLAANLSYAPGWPLQLPGEVASTPIVADLLGDGKLEVVAACRASADESRHIIEGEPLLYAFHVDGTVLPGWPIELQANDSRKPPKDTWNTWASSPSVFPRNGRDELITMAGRDGVVRITGDGQIHRLSKAGNWQNSVALADLDGDGTPDISIGQFVGNVDGKPVANWPNARRFRNGYSPCIGDPLEDGKLALFHLFYTANGAAYVDLGGFDAKGNMLPGWPRQIADPSWSPPVMGDVLGSGKRQIIASYGGYIFAWNVDGSGVPGTTSQPPLTGILKTDVEAYETPPSLADLDGAGKADIVVFDQNTQTIRAWHGDGTEVFPSTLDGYDGVIASLPTHQVRGVSIGSLGDDPKDLDFFAGTFWVRRLANGQIKTINMIPDLSQMAWSQPTIADVEQNGQADVIFGTADGRLCVYRTGLACHPERLQWPTANGNFQHTGIWRKTPGRAGG